MTLMTNPETGKTFRPKPSDVKMIRDRCDNAESKGKTHVKVWGTEYSLYWARQLADGIEVQLAEIAKAEEEDRKQEEQDIKDAQIR